VPAAKDTAIAVDAPQDDTSYHAVLRHENLLGEEPEGPSLVPVPPSRETHWPRLGAGLAASAATMPWIFLASGQGWYLPVLAALTAVTGWAGAELHHRWTRRELRRWFESLALRTERIFRGEPARGGNVADLESFFENMTASLERTLESQLRHERDAIIATITSLASALEARDPNTRNHSAQVGKLAARVGREMGLSRSELYELHLAGLLHDIGKIGIPDAILLKPAGLTRDEYEVMKGHSVLGARILSGLPGLTQVARIVLHHHEMYDGRGYPDGLAGLDIPLGARVISACDTYLAMAENRPYRNSQSMKRVYRELHRVAGRQLDPDVVDSLVALLIREESLDLKEIMAAPASTERAA